MKSGQNIQVADIVHRMSDANIQFNNYVMRDASTEPLFVYQSGVKYVSPPGWLSIPLAYDHYIIHFIIRGKGKFMPGDRIYPLKAGDAFLIRPYQQDAYQADVEDPYAYYWVGFNGTEADKLVTQCGFRDQQPTIQYDCDPELLSAMQQITNTHLTTPSQEYLLLSYLYRIFAILTEKNKSHCSSTYSDYCYNVSCYIRQHLSDPKLTVQQVAKHVGIDRSHLYRVFQDTMHQSVKSFILAARIQKANELLVHSNYRIGDVASSCGFNDTAYFIQQFKKLMGCTPLVYRQTRIRDHSGGH